MRKRSGFFYNEIIFVIKHGCLLINMFNKTRSPSSQHIFKVCQQIMLTMIPLICLTKRSLPNKFPIKMQGISNLSKQRNFRFPKHK